MTLVNVTLEAGRQLLGSVYAVEMGSYDGPGFCCCCCFPSSRLLNILPPSVLPYPELLARATVRAWRLEGERGERWRHRSRG